MAIIAISKAISPSSNTSNIKFCPINNYSSITKNLSQSTLISKQNSQILNDTECSADVILLQKARKTIFDSNENFVKIKVDDNCCSSTSISKPEVEANLERLSTGNNCSSSSINNINFSKSKQEEKKKVVLVDKDVARPSLPLPLNPYASILNKKPTVDKPGNQQRNKSLPAVINHPQEPPQVRQHSKKKMRLISCVVGHSGPLGEEEREQRKVNKQIDEQLQKEKQVLRATHRLLLLGAGESGKSTIVKQMRILHISGFNEAEKREKIQDIRRNIRDSITVVLIFNLIFILKLLR